MRFSNVLPVAIALLSTVVGCAAQTSDDSGAQDDDLKKTGTVTGTNAQTLWDALGNANAPSNTPAGMLGVGSRIARLELTTAQGGMAHFISRGARISTVDGADLGDLGTLNADWDALGKALTAGGVKWNVTQGDHGSSSSRMFAKVECSRVVSPSAKPSCKVTPITVTQTDANLMMKTLEDIAAPSSLPAGNVGVESHAARVTLTTSQGGTAKFISRNVTFATLDGAALGDLVATNVDWDGVRAALLDAGAVWTTENGEHGSSTSTIVATVDCSRPVAPSAKASCQIVPEPVETSN